MMTIIFAFIGWLVGYCVNQLADYLPAASEAETAVAFQWPAPGLWQKLRGHSDRFRPWFVELVAILLYAALPTLIPERNNLLVYAAYTAVLLLIIVIDLENRLIFDIVTYPATLLALLGSTLVTPDENSFWLAVVGAATGLLLLLPLYLLAQWIYGRGSAALGAGDVKLALMMGAMLGFPRIIFTLILGIFIGGIVTFVLLATRRVTRQTFLPYGQYLAVAAIIMLIWGAAYVQSYLN